MKKIDYCTYVLSDGSVANVFDDETVIWLNRRQWKSGKHILQMDRKTALLVLENIEMLFAKENEVI